MNRVAVLIDLSFFLFRYVRLRQCDGATPEAAVVAMEIRNIALHPGA